MNQINDDELTVEELRMNLEVYTQMLAGMSIEIANDRTRHGGQWGAQEVLDEYYKKAREQVGIKW